MTRTIPYNISSDDVKCVGAPTSAPTREDSPASGPRLGAPTLFLDHHGNEVERTYADFFRPMTAFQMAQAFPEERLLALRRRRQLRAELDRYDNEIGEIYISNEYSDEEKELLIVCVKTWRDLDPASIELKVIEAYLRMIPKHDKGSTSEPEAGRPKPSHVELLNIEKAKAFPLHELFDPQHVRETSGTITCCCPFHHERTPSFTIYKRANRYKCYSCGESGDSIHFYMKTHNVDFKTAVRALT